MQRCTSGGKLDPIEMDEAVRPAGFLKVFGDPDRIRILLLLDGREVCVSHLAQALGKSISAVSHQLSQMRSQRLVRYVKDGKNIYYTLDDDHVASLLEAALEHVAHA